MKDNKRKWILIPDYKPLWAMRECFGPTHGPLQEPCPTPLDIIGKLLRQDGRDALTIYEVLNPKVSPSDPVKLTLDNYTLPYHQILAGESVKPVSMEPVKLNNDPMKPDISESDKKVANTIKDLINGVSEPEPEKDPPASEPESPENPAQAEEITDTPKASADPEPEESPEGPDSDKTLEKDAEIEDNGTVVIDGTPTEDTAKVTDPYAGMSRSERRAARRAAAEAAAQSN